MDKWRKKRFLIRIELFIFFSAIVMIGGIFNISLKAADPPEQFQPGILYNANEFNFNEKFYGFEINLTGRDGDYKDPYYEGGTIKWSI